MQLTREFELRGGWRELLNRYYRVRLASLNRRRECSIFTQDILVLQPPKKRTLHGRELRSVPSMSQR